MKSFKSSLFSRCFGRFASYEFPSFLQKIINYLYVRFMGVNLKDFNDFKYYKSLNSLFTRKLLKKRDIDTTKETFISPCDGFVSKLGEIKESIAYQIKGFSYKIDELFGKNIKLKDSFKNGKYINFYLSPKDYHRYHTPFDMRVLKAVHIPGKLYPVNFKWLKKIPNLFIENERVILECKTEDERVFYMVFVGALNVGKMNFVFDDKIKTNVKNSQESIYLYDNVNLKKGDELGMFEMGSTIVIFFEENFIEFVCKEQSEIKFGDVIGKQL